MDNHVEAEKAEPDPRPAVLAYLERRSCCVCNAPLETVGVADLEPFHGVRFRMYPPHPTCWSFGCPSCGQQIVVCVREGRSWVLRPSSVSRRRPRRRGGE